MERIKEGSLCEFTYVIAKDIKGHKAAGFDKDKKLVAQTEYGSIEDVQLQITKTLGAMSQEFVGVDGAKARFISFFPGGFSDEKYRLTERREKDAAIMLANELLEPYRMGTMISGGETEGLFDDVKKVINKAQLLFSQFEIMAVKNCIKTSSQKNEFCKALHALLYSEDFDSAFNKFVALMKTYNLAKWPLITYFPYIVHPDTHMFLKPTVTIRCAERMGWNLEYESEPNLITYKNLLTLVSHVRGGVKSLSPRDNIDIQSLFYVVASDGYAEEALKLNIDSS